MKGRWAARARGVSTWERADEALTSLALQVLEDALVSRTRGAVVPFAVVEAAGSASLHRFDAGLDAARQWLVDVDADRAVLAYEDVLLLRGESFFVVYAEAHERGSRAAARIGQRYLPNGEQEPKLLGELFDAGDVAPLLGAS